jgi:Kef-type K+ transport system membrane component KefB
MSHITEIFLGIFIVYVSAQVGAEIAQRLKLPAVVGEITAGLVVGGSVLRWIEINEPLEVLAEIGAILLLFSVGLETRIGDLRRVGRAATLTGIGGVILPFILGAAWASLSGMDTPRALFVASAFVATSAGITARVLKDLGVLNHTASRVILGAAVIDDILAMLLLAVVTSLQGGGRVGLVSLAVVFAQAIGFVALVALVGTRVMRRSSPWLEVPINPLSPLTIALALCLGLALAATFLGLAAIIGAFLAGMAAAETTQRESLEKQLRPILAFLVPFFFVVTGAKVVLSDLASLSTLGAIAVVTVLAIIGKLVGSGLGAISLGRKNALIVGTGMVPRGEVGIIIASLGQQAGIITGATYAIIIAMSLLTSIVAPPVLGALLREKPAPTASFSGEAGGPPERADAADVELLD